jgi:hypothetical protein
MLGSYRVSKQLGISRVVLSSVELVRNINDKNCVSLQIVTSFFKNNASLSIPLPEMKFCEDMRALQDSFMKSQKLTHD